MSEQIKSAVCVVVLILVLMYFLMPDLFERYFLMNLSIYRNNVKTDFDSIKIMRFNDKTLDDLISKSHTSLMKLLLMSQKELCANKYKAIAMIKENIKNSKEDALKMNELNNLCSADSLSYAKNNMFTEKNEELKDNDVYKSIHHNANTSQLAKDLFNLYSYALSKYFCKGGKFDIDMLEKYLIAMVEDLCSADTNVIDLVNINSNYLLRKPFTYYQ